MKFVEFQKIATKQPFFSTSDLYVYDPQFNRFQITEWLKKGYIRRLKRGHYILADFTLSERELYVIANKLYEPSYVSLESALRYYNLIPEGVYTITSLSINKTSEVISPIGRFHYHSITPAFYFGYALVPSRLGNARMAEPEKALMDYLYFHPHLTGPQSLVEMRFSHHEFHRIYSTRRLRAFIARIPRRGARSRIAEILRDYL